MILTRFLGVDQYGLYSYTIIIVTAAATFSTLGFDNAALRFLPEYKVKKQWEYIHGYAFFSFKIILCSSVLVACLLVTIGELCRSKNNELSPLLILSAPLIPLFTVSRIRQYLLRSLKHVILAEILELLARPLLLAVFLFYFQYIEKTPVTAATILTIHIPLTLFLCSVGLYWVYRYLPHKNSIAKRVYDKKKWGQVALPLLFVSVMQLATGYSDTIMLGMLSSYTDAGIYSVAIRISTFAGFSLLAMNMILAPLISELFFSDKHQNLQHIITTTTRWATIISLFISITLVFCGEFILSLFGNGFEKAYLPLLILLFGQLLNVACGSVGLILSLTGYQSYTAKVLTVSSFLNILLNFFLIPRYGMVGAAVASAISIGVWNVTMARNVSKRLNIQSTILKLTNAKTT